MPWIWIAFGSVLWGRNQLSTVILLRVHSHLTCSYIQPHRDNVKITWPYASIAAVFCGFLLEWMLFNFQQSRFVIKFQAKSLSSHLIKDGSWDSAGAGRIKRKHCLASCWCVFVSLRPLARQMCSGRTKVKIKLLNIIVMCKHFSCFLQI